ncbi:hypothetical protein L2E82_08931 [Cichorium intybus]|uniref:Uncharacterized protein n=1 Tax=Cichorium intybus TaxID=13427 RepID=A0ACB9G791_CICIN|nr:hypothetical protein L2E82_08931 [Cichorium intybus]
MNSSDAVDTSSIEETPPKEEVDVIMNSNDVVDTSAIEDASPKEEVDVFTKSNDVVDTSLIVVFIGLSSITNSLS